MNAVAAFDNAPLRDPDAAAEALHISVVICTRNRASQLAEVLTSASHLTVPDGLRWELLLVDNGSTDATTTVAVSFEDRLPIRVVREPVPGLSNARNRGVKEARGRYLCWTDDDVELDPGWLNAYVQAFEQHPDAAFFGGKVLPVLEGGQAPEWFRRRQLDAPLCHLLAYRDFGDEPLPLSFDAARMPYGANFAVRTAEQRAALYDPQLGVSPLHKMLGEESDVLHRIAERGGTGWWVPGATVHHRIPLARQSRSYIFEYYFLAGQTMAHVRRQGNDSNFLTHGGVEPAGYRLSPWRCLRRGASCLLQFSWARRKGNLFWLNLLADAGYFLGAASYASRFSNRVAAIRHYV